MKKFIILTILLFVFSDKIISMEEQYELPELSMGRDVFDSIERAGRELKQSALSRKHSLKKNKYQLYEEIKKDWPEYQKALASNFAKEYQKSTQKKLNKALKKAFKKCYINPSLDDEAKIAKLLLAGASPDVDLPVPGYTTLLLYISKTTNLRRLLHLLILCGANINFTDRDGTPLMHASECGNLLVLEKLLEFGADKEAKNIHGDTALILAAKQGRDLTVRTLLENGVRPNNQNQQDNRTALHHAVFYGHTNTVGVLLEHKVSCNLPDRYGKTPLAYAAERNHGDIRQSLELRQPSFSYKKFIIGFLALMAGGLALYHFFKSSADNQLNLTTLNQNT